MARPDVLVLGEGPPPPDADPPPPADALVHTRFPTLRLWQGVRALAAAGLRVQVLAVGPPPPAPTLALGGARPGWTVMPEGDSLAIVAREVERLTPGCVVSLGPFAPARWASALPPGPPVWIDIPGDPMAEAQLRAEDDPAHVAPYRGVLLGALARGDAFSACSTRQRDALLGQLGLVGRLTTGALDQPRVAVIPPAVDPSWLGPARPWDRLPPRAPAVALVGGLNTWADGDALLAALDVAMAARPDLRVVILGGGVPGFSEDRAARFGRVWAARPWAHRVIAPGWIPQDEVLGAVDASAVVLSLDRACVEAHLGARTRLLLAVARGRAIVTTPLGEGARDLVARGLAHGVDVGDGPAAGRALLRALEGAPPSAEARAAFLGDATPEATMAPLVAWARAPSRAPAGEGGGALGEARARLAAEAELARLRASPTLRILNRLHRALGGRRGGA